MTHCHEHDVSKKRGVSNFPINNTFRLYDTWDPMYWPTGCTVTLPVWGPPYRVKLEDFTDQMLKHEIRRVNQVLARKGLLIP